MALLGPCFKTGSARTQLPKENYGPSAIDPAGFTLIPHFGDSAFPSRYSYAIGLGDIRFLGWKTPPLHSALPTTATLRGLTRRKQVPGYYRSAPLHRGSLPLCVGPSHSSLAGFGTGTSRFARRYSGCRVCFRFLPLLICLSSGSIRSKRAPGGAAPGELTAPVTAPFGHRGLRTSPVAPDFRILLRPSSFSEPTDPPTGLVG